MVECSVPGCVGKVAHRGWCKRHYERWRIYGDPLYRMYNSKYDSLETRLLRGSVEVGSGCRIWAMGTDKNGYGVVTYMKQVKKAHRLAYETWVGPIPDGLLIRHKCDNPPCINPDHLETGTHAENARDRADRGRNSTAFGDQKPQTKIRNQDGLDIRREYGYGVLTQRMLAEVYGVSISTIRRVLDGTRTIVEVTDG